jgi:hypothetical protein
MKASTAGAVAVRFNLYGCPDLSLDVVARRVARALAVPLESRTSPVRGVYYRWTGRNAADVLLQANVPDEEGVLVEPAHATFAALLYATGLDDEAYDALARVEGLCLLDAEVLFLR